MFNPLFSIV